jgi:hypothetical protein
MTGFLNYLHSIGEPGDIASPIIDMLARVGYVVEVGHGLGEIRRAQMRDVQTPRRRPGMMLMPLTDDSLWPGDRRPDTITVKIARGSAVTIVAARHRPVYDSLAEDIEDGSLLYPRGHKAPHPWTSDRLNYIGRAIRHCGVVVGCGLCKTEGEPKELVYLAWWLLLHAAVRAWAFDHLIVFTEPALVWPLSVEIEGFAAMEGWIYDEHGERLALLAMTRSLVISYLDQRRSEFSGLTLPRVTP